MKTSLKGIIFDLDGTLIDSKLDFAFIRKKLGFPEKAPILEHIETLSPQEKQIALHTLDEIEKDAAQKSSPIPGAPEMLLHLAQKKIRFAIFTRNSLLNTRLSLSHLPPTLEFSPLIARESCAPKPSHQGILNILSQWHLKPSQVLMVGDYLYDLQAAKAAGVRAWLYWPKTLEKAPPSFADLADRILTDLLEIPNLIAELETVRC